MHYAHDSRYGRLLVDSSLVVLFFDHEPAPGLKASQACATASAIAAYTRLGSTARSKGTTITYQPAWVSSYAGGDSAILYRGERLYVVSPDFIEYPTSLSYAFITRGFQAFRSHYTAVGNSAASVRLRFRQNHKFRYMFLKNATTSAFATAVLDGNTNAVLSTAGTGARDTVMELKPDATNSLTINMQSVLQDLNNPSIPIQILSETAPIPIVPKPITHAMIVPQSFASGFVQDPDIDFALVLDRSEFDIEDPDGTGKTPRVSNIKLTFGTID